MKSLTRTNSHHLSSVLTFLAIVCFHLTNSQAIGEPGKKDFTLPTITEDVLDKVVPKDYPTQLNCRAEGNPPPRISWLKNNEPLVECQGCGFSDRAGTLFFLDVGIAHAGVYRCQATNSVGTVRGRNATLQIAYLRPDFRPGPSSTVAIVGNDVVLECIPPKGNPVPEVGWEKDDEPIEETDRLQIMEDYNLMISSVRLEDAGSYVCTAFNMAVENPVKSSPANLTVRATPTFLVVPEDIIAEPGETVLFRCEVAGDPPPDLSWKKQTGELPVGRHEIKDDGSLEIRNVHIQDAGNYHCVVKKDHGVYQEAATLRIGDDPAFNVLPRDQTVSVDDNVALHCEAGGNPPPEVFWQNDEVGLTLQPGASRGRFRVDSQGTLHISGAQEDDEGTYVCSTNSGSGNVQASALVRVIGSSLSPPPVIRTGPFDQTLMEGSTAVFYCLLVDDVGEVQWTKEGEPIQERNRFSVDGSHTLRILSVQPADTASYSCMVTNASGESSWSASLTVIRNNQPSLVQPPPNIPDLPGAPLSLSAINVTRNSVQLSWESPAAGDAGRPPVTSYRLEYFTPNTALGWVKVDGIISATTHVVTGLQPGTPYVFIARGINSNGVGIPSRVSSPVVTLAAYTGDDQGTAFIDSVSVDITKAVPLSPTSILLQWEISRSDVTLDGFKIKCRPSSGQGNSILKTVMGDSSHIVTGLIPDEDYTVSVQPFHRERDGTESSLEAVRTLPEGQLAPPPSIPNSLLESKLNLCGLAVTGAYPVSATKLQLTWSVNRYAAYIDGYHISYYPTYQITKKKIMTVTDSRSLVLTDLDPWNSYTIVVTPFNGLYKGTESDPLIGVTAEDIPRVSPSSVQVSPNGSTSLIVSWTPPSSSRVKGIVTGYSVFCLSNSTNAGQNKTINNPIVVVTRITQLTPSAWYRVSVAAHTSAGMGPLSAPYVIQMPPSIPIRPPTGDDENGLIIKVVGIVTLIAFIGAVILLVVFCRKRHEKSVVVTKGSLHYEPTSEGIGLTLAPHLHSHQKGAQQPLPPIPTDDAESCHGNISLLTTFSTTNGTLSSTVGRYWPAAHTPLNHDQAGPAYWLLEQQDPSYTSQGGMHNQATLSSGSSTLSGHRARSPVYAVVDEEDLTQDPHCPHTLPMHQCTIVSNPAVNTLPPQPYASTQLCPPQNTHFATAPKCTCGSSSNDTGCSSGTSGSQPCPNGTASKPSRAKSKPHRKKRSQRLQQPQQHQQRPANTWSDLLPPPPEEPPTDSRVPPHMQAPPYNYHTGSSNGSKSSHHSHPHHHQHPHQQQQQQYPAPPPSHPVPCHECMQNTQENMTLPAMHYPPPQYPSSMHYNQRTFPHVDAYRGGGGPVGLPPGTRIDPTSGRVFQPIARPNGQYPQEGVHYPQNGGHHTSENGGHHLAPKQVFEDPRHAEIGQELLQYNDLMSQSEAPSDNEEGHPMLPRITPGISEQGIGSIPAVSELSDLDTVRGEVDTDFDGSSYCTGSLMASGLSIGGSCAEDEASEGSEEGERFLNGYPTHPTNSLPMVTIGNGIQVGSQV